MIVQRALELLVVAKGSVGSTGAAGGSAGSTGATEVGGEADMDGAANGLVGDAIAASPSVPMAI